MIHKVELSDEDVRDAIVEYIGLHLDKDVNPKQVHIKATPKCDDPREPKCITGYSVAATVVINK